jgi:hypothetical protein
MIPYVVEHGDITKLHLDDLERVRSIVKRLPMTETWTCHAICKALTQFSIHWKWETGCFGHWGWEHSWMRRGDVILDVYPWCAAEPILVFVRAGSSPWAQLYAAPEDMSLLVSIKNAQTTERQCLKIREFLEGQRILSF